MAKQVQDKDSFKDSQGAWEEPKRITRQSRAELGGGDGDSPIIKP
jgi:hypothetical protein